MFVYYIFCAMDVHEYFTFSLYNLSDPVDSFLIHGSRIVPSNELPVTSYPLWRQVYRIYLLPYLQNRNIQRKTVQTPGV